MSAFSDLERDLGRGWHLPADAAPIRFSDHAVERFGERARPGLPLEEVERQLRLMLKSATISFEAPEWFTRRDQGAWGFLLLGDHVLPLFRHGDELWASTSMDRGSIGDERRETRNKARAWKRDGRRRARVVQKLESGRERSGPSADEWDGAASASSGT